MLMNAQKVGDSVANILGQVATLALKSLTFNSPALQPAPFFSRSSSSVGICKFCKICEQGAGSAGQQQQVQMCAGSRARGRVDKSAEQSAQQSKEAVSRLRLALLLLLCAFLPVLYTSFSFSSSFSSSSSCCCLWPRCGGGTHCRLVHLPQRSAPVETDTSNLPHWNARSPTLFAFKKSFSPTFENIDNWWRQV